MSQADIGTINTATTSGSALATLLQNWRSALHTMHSGTSRPAYVQAGMMWLDTTGVPWVIKLYDGTVDIPLGYVDATDDIAWMLSSSRTKTVSSAYSVVAGDRDMLILVDATAGPVTVTMITGANAKSGFNIAVMKSDVSANAVTIARQGSDVFSGATSLVLNSRFENYRLISSGGAQWYIASYYVNKLPVNRIADHANNTIAGRNAGTNGPRQDLTPAQVRTLIDVDQAGILTVDVNSTGTNYQLTLTDRGGLIRANNAAANTITIPDHATVALPHRTRIDFIQWGTGQTTFVPAVGVTLNSAGGRRALAERYSGATLVKIGNNNWSLIGDLV